MSTADPYDEQPGLLLWLQGWYTSQCDGDWEHCWGIKIDTLDNPGWFVRINLEGTSCEDKAFDRMTVQRDEHDWVHAWVEGKVFHAACGPTNLSEALYTFREWVLF